MKRFITLVLALAMIATMFVACSKKGDDATESTSGNVESSKPGEDTNKPGDETDKPGETTNDLDAMGLPSDIDFGKKEVNIVHWNSGYPEFSLNEEEMTGEAVEQAVFNRNMYTEELLKVTLSFTHNEYIGNSVGEMQQWCDVVKNMMEDPNTPVDVFASYSRVLATATMNGLNQDLTPYTNLDLSKEWWPKNIQNEFSLKGKLFIITGDISTSLLNNMYCIFYNRTLAEQNNYNDIVKLVNDKEWTIDKMMEITEGIYQDVDGEDGATPGDIFGFTCAWWCLDAMIQGAGFKLLKAPEDDDEIYITLTEDFTSQKFDQFVSKMGTWADSDDVIIEDAYSGFPNTIFLEGRSIFLVQQASFGSSLQATDIKYGILPPPMLDPEGQNNTYVTTLANGYSIFSVSRNCKDPEMATATLQSLGYYGYKYVTPAVFEVTFKGKYSKAPEVIGMFDLVRESIGFDLGLLYQREVNSINDIPTWAITKNNQWLGKDMAKPQQKSLERALKVLNKKLAEVVNA